MNNLLTEGRNPRSVAIDQRATLDILQIINDEDATVAVVVRTALPEIARVVDGAVERIRAGGRLIYVGAGTSGRLAVLDAVECVPTYSVPPTLVIALLAGGDAALTHSIEGAEDDADAGRTDLLARSVTAQDTVIGIAASGRTPYVVGALHAANEIGALTAAISCSAPAPILEIAQIKIAALVGAEVVSGSTRMKAGTAQKLILNMISTTTMIRLGKVYDNLMIDVKPSNDKLNVRARRIVSEVAGVDDAHAGELLVHSNNEVKTAVVVALLGVTPEEARTRLAVADGVLRSVIENKSSAS
ncbi:MAG: N-acetylmuramic acid 6-phosphate etherase [Chloroflexota bacterium]|nr:N-acetylmuramic acid 6-phosphate etherase [Chloroflexota bacterium]